MPLLSCITTTFNDGPLLMTSVESLLAQAFEDFELIIVDDGSSENTRAILDTLSDPRITVIRQANDGLSSARNRGLSQAKGDYICFLDADDSRPAWAFATIARDIEHHAPDLILCRGALSEVRDAPFCFYDTPQFEKLETHCPQGTLDIDTPDADVVRSLAYLAEPQSANKVVRRAFLEENGLCFPNTHFFEDVFFHVNALARSRKTRFLQTPCFTYFRRYSRPQITAGSGDRRFDIIPVTRLTLETFARTPYFDDRRQRAAVLCACMKLLTWCGSTIGHGNRPHFWQLTHAMCRLVDPGYFAISDSMFDELSIPEDVRKRVRGIVNAF